MQALQHVRLPDKFMPYLEWGPDYSPLNNQGLYRALNTLPVPNGLGPFPKLVEQTAPLDDRCLGGIAVDDGQGTWLFFAGDKSKLYSLVDGVFNDVSKVGGYNVSVDDQWKFIDWGEYILATNVGNPLQVGIARAVTQFGDAITDTRKPQAKYMSVIGQRLVLANTSDALEDQQPRRLWWGPLGDYANFDPDPTTGANYVDRIDGGVLTGITGGKEFGTAFQTGKILRLDPVGGAAVFNISPLDEKRGCPFPNSIISHGRMTFFLSEDGVYYNDGSQSNNISYGKVNRQIWKIYDSNRPNDISVAIDRKNNLLVLAVPQNKVKVKRLFIYNMLDGRWTEGEQDIEVLIQYRKLGYTLDGMTPDYPNIDVDVPYSLDNDFWKGGRLEIGAFNANHILATFTGPNLPVSVVTNLFNGDDGRGVANKVSVNRGWPLIHGEQLGSMRLIRRNELYQDDTVGEMPMVGPWGVIDRGRVQWNTQNEARYHQLELYLPEGAVWDMIEGVNVEMARDGGRIG